jgi:hypothetical protein
MKNLPGILVAIHILPSHIILGKKARMKMQMGYYGSISLKAWNCSLQNHHKENNWNKTYQGLV